MFKNEAEFSRTLKTWLEEEGMAVQPIESAGVAVGIPDIYFSDARCKGWIELKNVKSLNQACNVPLRPGQYAWLRRFCKKGTFCVLMVAYGEGIAVIDNKRIKARFTADEIRSYTVPETGEACVEAIIGAYNEENNTASGIYDDLRIESISPDSGYISLSGVFYNCGNS